MMKTAPRSTFKVVQAQVILGALKVLFNVPAGTTQLQAARATGRAMEVRQVIMVRFLVATRPVDHQPNLFQFSLTLAQAMLQVNFTPRQPGPTRLTVRRLPRAVFPLLGREAEHDLGQGLSGRNGLRRTMSGPLPLDGHGLGPGFVRRRHLQHKLHPQLAYSLPEVWTIPVHGVTQDGRGWNAVGLSLPDQVQRQLRLGLELHLGGHSHFRASLRIFRPVLRQIEAPRDGSGHPAIAYDNFHADLAVGLLAHGTAILVTDAHRVLTLFQPSAFVYHPSLLFYQQSWTNPVLENLTGKAMLLGGFTTQNSDSEWSDARGSLAGEVLLDYYQATGKAEYLERGVEALRSQFPISPAENWAHGGYGHKEGVSSFHWGTGSGLAGIEIEEEFLRDAVVDVHEKRGVGVNGLNFTACHISEDRITLQIESPFRWTRRPVVIFHHTVPTQHYRLAVNGTETSTFAGSELERGVPLPMPTRSPRSESK